MSQRVSYHNEPKGRWWVSSTPFGFIFGLSVQVLFCSSFANYWFKRISARFQHHFRICLLWFLHKKECTFYNYRFCCTELRWMLINLTAICFTSLDTGLVAARSELTISKCEWNRIVDETTQSLIDIEGRRGTHCVCLYRAVGNGRVRG